MSRKETIVTLEFVCPPEVVWQALTDPNRYSLWYRNPEGFADDLKLFLGAKLNFYDQPTTSIVTMLEPFSRMEVSAATFTDLFVVGETASGCTVTLQRGDENAEQVDGAALVLDKLHAVVFSDGNPTVSPRGKTAKRRKVGGVNDIISGVLQGYRTPLGTHRGALEDSEKISGIIGANESEEAINLRSYLVGLICVVLLFVTLSQSFRFERSDIVPSSGMSVRESDDVNKENIALIEIGTPQNTLERLINCRGQRLSNTEFYYCSVTRTPDGRRHSEAYITYDAYGHVRRILYLDNSQQLFPLSMTYVEANAYLLPDMTVTQMEEALNYPLSAFSLDKSGVRQLYFGRIFDLSGGKRTDYTAELVVESSVAQHYVDARYYYEVRAGNPLYITEIGADLRYQYRNLDEYTADLEAYERIFLLLGRQRREADAVLGTEGVDYRATYDGGVICSYLVKNRASEETFYRYLYTVTIGYDDLVQEIIFENRLLGVRYDTIQDPEAYSIREGMSLYQVCDIIPLLPTYAKLDGETLTLCYGAVDTTSEVLEKQFRYVLVFNAATLLLESYEIMS